MNGAQTETTAPAKATGTALMARTVVARPSLLNGVSRDGQAYAAAWPGHPAARAALRQVVAIALQSGFREGVPHAKRTFLTPTYFNQGAD